MQLSCTQTHEDSRSEKGVIYSFQWAKDELSQTQRKVSRPNLPKMAYMYSLLFMPVVMMGLYRGDIQTKSSWEIRKWLQLFVLFRPRSNISPYLPFLDIVSGRIRREHQSRGQTYKNCSISSGRLRSTREAAYLLYIKKANILKIWTQDSNKMLRFEDERTWTSKLFQKFQFFIRRLLPSGGTLTFPGKYGLWNMRWLPVIRLIQETNRSATCRIARLVSRKYLDPHVWGSLLLVP